MNVFNKFLFVAILLMNFNVFAEDATYEESKALLLLNCSECGGVSREELERGILGMESLLNDGYEIPYEGMLLLADSYNQLAFRYFESGSTERTQLFGKRDNIYASLGAQVLKSVEQEEVVAEEEKLLYKSILVHYASVLDRKGAFNVFEKVLVFLPNDSEIEFMSGLILVELGREGEGFSKMEEAFANAQHDEAFNQGVELIGMYNDRKRYEDAERIVTVLESKDIDQNISSLRENFIATYQSTKLKNQTTLKESTSQPLASEVKLEANRQHSEVEYMPEVGQEKVHPTVRDSQNNILLYILVVMISVLVFGGILMKLIYNKNDQTRHTPLE